MRKEEKEKLQAMSRHATDMRRSREIEESGKRQAEEKVRAREDECRNATSYPLTLVRATDPDRCHIREEDPFGMHAMSAVSQAFFMFLFAILGRRTPSACMPCQPYLKRSL